MFFGNKKKISHLKVGLALSGGTALGIAHVGVIKALRENKIKIDCVSGTSAGAIAAACLAFNVPIKKMIEISNYSIFVENAGDSEKIHLRFVWSTFEAAITQNLS